MAPFTHPWRGQLSPANGGDAGLFTLVLEDFEVFEAETAELTIEEVDDYASSLLLSNDPACPTPVITHPNSGLVSNDSDDAEGVGNAVARNFHTLIHSPHSLATTSVVIATQHAQTTEYNLLTVADPDVPMASETYQKTIIPVAHCRRVPRAPAGSNGENDAVMSGDSQWWTTVPAHVLAVVSHTGLDCTPATWPEQLLVCTDAPAFVRAVHGDLLEAFGSVRLFACDEAPHLTTCQATCCQADLDVLECRVDQCVSVHRSGGSTDEEQFIPLLADANRILLPDSCTLKLHPLSGVRPDIPSYSTAIYLLLTADSSPGSVDPTSSSVPLVAMLTALVPSSAHTTAQLKPLRIGHPVHPVESRLVPGVDQLLSGSQLHAFAVLVDLVHINSQGDEPEQNVAIIHQRLHHLPELKFRVQALID